MRIFVMHNITLFVGFVLFIAGGCASENPKFTATGAHPDARWTRGGPDPDADCAFSLWPAERAKLVHEIKKLCTGLPMHMVIERLGEPDFDEIDSFKAASHGRYRNLYYIFTERRLNKARSTDQRVALIFTNDNKFWYFHNDGVPELPQFGGFPPGRGAFNAFEDSPEPPDWMPKPAAR